MALAVGLGSALLHCSSFRYFHSPCRVLCTFRSPYLCNIGCRADRGALIETPRRIRLHFQATLHWRRQQSAGTPAGEATAKRDHDPMSFSPSVWLEEPFHALVPSLLLTEEKWLPVMPLRFVHPSPARSARGSRPRREAELFPDRTEPKPFPATGNSGHLPLGSRSAGA